MKTLKHVGARRGAAGCLCRKSERTGLWPVHTPGRVKPACARRTRSAANSRLPSQHHWPHPEPGSEAQSCCRQGDTASEEITHECARTWRGEESSTRILGKARLSGEHTHEHRRCKGVPRIQKRIEERAQRVQLCTVKFKVPVEYSRLYEEVWYKVD